MQNYKDNDSEFPDKCVMKLAYFPSLERSRNWNLVWQEADCVKQGRKQKAISVTGWNGQTRAHSFY